MMGELVHRCGGLIWAHRWWGGWGLGVVHQLVNKSGGLIGAHRWWGGWGLGVVHQLVNRRGWVIGVRVGELVHRLVG